jgi:hypothetical protein
MHLQTWHVSILNVARCWQERRQLSFPDHVGCLQESKIFGKSVVHKFMQRDVVFYHGEGEDIGPETNFRAEVLSHTRLLQTPLNEVCLAFGKRLTHRLLHRCTLPVHIFK